MLIFESLLTEGIAQLSYLVGDTSTGSAAVVDPRPDVDVYLEMAERHGVSITHVLETHKCCRTSAAPPRSSPVASPGFQIHPSPVMFRRVWRLRDVPT